MEARNNECYDLMVLFERSDLNIRKIATSVKTLTAGDYFDMLSELMRNAPQFSKDLLKLMNRDGDRNTYKNLSSMFTLLRGLGYDKHEVDFEGMLDAYDRGQSRLTSVYAKKILSDFDELCDQVTAAKLNSAPEDFSVDPYAVLLKEWLDQRYVEEEAVHKPVILAVDDSPVILKSVSSLLSDDYKVYMLAKSVMLEKTLGQIRPDLFLLDYNMPIINGFELIPVIRNFVEHKNTPIIFLTSEGTIDNISSAVMLGACDFIAKPVKPSILRERIGKHIDRKEAS